MLKNLKIGPRLLVLVIIQILFMVSIGIISLRSIQATNAGLNTVYNDRVVPLRQLSIISDLYTRKIFNSGFEARDGTLSPIDAIKAIDSSMAKIKQEWNAYLATFLVESEEALVKQITPLMIEADQAIDHLRELLAHQQPNQQSNELAKFLETTLNSAINTLDPKLAALADVQIRVAQEEYNGSSVRYRKIYFSMIVIIGVAIALAAIFSFFIIRSITQPLTDLRVIFDKLADGNLKTEANYDGRRDEIGQMTQAIVRHLDALKLAGEDRKTLIDGARGGMLTVRVDPNRHRGDFAALAQGDNDLVETLSTPLFEVASVMAKLASGDVRGRMSGAYEGDLRALKGNVNRSLEGLATLLTEISEFANAMAAGDIRRSIEGAYQGDFAAIKVNMNRAMAQLREVITAVAQATFHVAHSAAETRTAANDVSHQVTSQTTTLSDLSAAIEQTAAAVHDIARQVDRGSNLARDTATAAEDGQAKLDNLTSAVERIQSGNTRIAHISNLIANIADKTYVLALNAGLEAVRAGEQGRGFGLIAHQITQLSEEVARATRDIRGLIEDATNYVQTGVNAAQAAGGAITRIVVSARDSDATIQAIAAAVEQQSATIQDLKDQVNQLHATGESTAAAAEEISATMVGLDEMAKHLQAESARIRIS